MMMKKERYNKVIVEYGAKEAAQNFVFPAELSKADKKKADADLLAVLNEKRSKTSIAQRRKMALLQLRLVLEDYLSGSEFDAAKNLAIS